MKRYHVHPHPMKIKGIKESFAMVIVEQVSYHRSYSLDGFKLYFVLQVMKYQLEKPSKDFPGWLRSRHFCGLTVWTKLQYLEKIHLSVLMTIGRLMC